MKRRQQEGFILIAVLVIVVLASMVALSLLFRMRAEQAAFSATTGSEQAWYTVMSGVQRAMDLAKTAGSDPAQWENNAEAFSHQLVVDDGSDKWYFSIFSPSPPEEESVRFGIVDEARKVNLNLATPDMLGKCTFLSAEQIAILTGTGPTNTAAAVADPLSAEALLGGPSRQHFSTLDELLKLPGFAPGVIYGEDANHNFRLDPNEDDGVLLFPPDDSDGQLFLGLRPTATVFTYELNLTRDGLPRFQINSTNRTIPDQLIPQQTAAFLQTAWSNNLVFTNIADLLEAKSIKGADGKTIEIDSGVTARELPVILDKLTTHFESRLPGRVNVNTADLRVLQTIPGITEGKAELIVQTRESLAAELKESPAWLYSQEVLTAAEFKQALPWMTTRSFQFRFNALGYALPSGRYRIYEVVIDTADRQPQIIYLRDITKFGLPFPLPAPEETQNVPTQTPSTI